MFEEEGVLTIHLVRHGETLATREHRLCGQSDCALSELGRLQSEAVVESCAAAGDWRAVYTSPLSRCRAMAEAVAERLLIPLSVENDHEGQHEDGAGAHARENVRAQWPVALRIEEAHRGGGGEHAEYAHEHDLPGQRPRGCRLRCMRWP